MKSSNYFSQEYLKDNVNLYTADKSFDLNLINDGSKYFNKFSIDGNHLLCYSNRGFLSSINLNSLKANFEIEDNSIDKIFDATYLHNEHYVAVTQSDSLFIYNNQGVEINVVREISKFHKLQFLPHHFLLAALNKDNLKYLDTSIGKVITDDIKILNNEVVTSHEGVIYLSHPNGVITLHAPMQDEYLLKIKATNKGGIVDIKTDNINNKLYVSTNDNRLRVFDIRNTFNLLNEVVFSTNLNRKEDDFVSPGLYNISTTTSGKVALFDNKRINLLESKSLKLEYYTEIGGGNINSCNFSPFDDICAVTTNKNLKTLIFPNTAYTDYDSRENSPFLTKKQRKEKEVRMILEKIPADMISYNSEIFKKYK